MVAVGGDLDVPATQAYLEDVCVPALQAWMGRPASVIASVTRLSFAKLNRIAPDGTYAEPTTVQYFWPSAWPGGATATNTAAMVPQAALALTWETATVSRGLASKGRIYSPSPCVTPVIGTGLFASADCTTIAESAAQLISDLRGDGDAGAMTPNIVSDSGAGVAHRIDRVAVDNRVDIIRKRANQLRPVRLRVDVPA